MTRYPARVHGQDLRDEAAGPRFGPWNSFWFQPQPMIVLGIVRICFGLLVAAWAIALLPDLLTFFGSSGVSPHPMSIPYTWGLLHLFPADQAVFTVWAMTLLSALALAAGWHSRAAALVVFVCLMSFTRRDPSVINSGDALLVVEALFLTLAPSGAALSLDRRRTAGSFWTSQRRAPWAVRLLQVQMCLIYLTTVQLKLRGETWIDGSAVSYALRLPELANFQLPGWLVGQPQIMQIATWGTLFVEFALATLVWNLRLRPWILCAGATLHLSILATIKVGCFSFAVFILYLAFIPPSSAVSWLSRLSPKLTPPFKGRNKRISPEV
ncbi:HTTM domain-containing protein [Streptomyces sp. NPDC056480]|uniref:HTTM domain-containing protein n=1 Tax=Streptomyces sp. NPDC056480 TaxID=3345833 RepID=UPI003697942A